MAAAGWRVSCAHLASDERLVHVGDDNAAQRRGCSLHGSCPQRRAGCDPSRRGGNGDQAVRRGAEQQEHGARTGHESDRYVPNAARLRAAGKPRRVTALPPLDTQEWLFALNCWKRARRCASTRRSILVPARTPQCTPRALGSASPSHRPVPVGRAAPAPCVLRHPDTSSHHGPPPPSLPQRRAAASFCRCSS